jgi:hypothetical protein
MRVAFLGNFGVSHSTESHLGLTLEAMNHTVLRLQENKVTMDDVTVTANSCDLFIWVRTYGWLQFDGHEMLKRIKVRRMSYHLDLVNKIARASEVPYDPFWRTDICFQPDGGSKPFFDAHNINAYYMKAGVYDKECYIADEKPDLDVVFVGSVPYHPEWPYREELVRFLRHTYCERFHKFGNERTVRGDALNKVYARSKVVVGDTLCPGFNHPHYWSDRVYETLGRGGFIIHPWIKGMQEEFIDGVHLRYYEYGNFRELRRLIEYYIKHDRERENMRQLGHDFVKANCTYRNRLDKAIAVTMEMPVPSGGIIQEVPVEPPPPAPVEVVETKKEEPPPAPPAQKPPQPVPAVPAKMMVEPVDDYVPPMLVRYLP